MMQLLPALERLPAPESSALGRSPGEVFDRLTRLAARTLDAPAALISLVESGGLRVQSRFGLEPGQADCLLDTCTSVLRGPDVLVIPDATPGGRGADLPVVPGAAHLRFCAGARLVTRTGHLLGTLCIFDTRPRGSFSGEEAAVLSDLAALVVNELESRRSRHEASREAHMSKLQARDLQDALNLAQLLGGISDLAALDLPPEALLPHVVELVSSALDVDWGGLLALREDSGTLLSHWHRQPGTAFVTQVGHRVRRESGGLLWRAAGQAHPLFMDDYAGQRGGRADLTRAGGGAVVSARLGQEGPVTYVMTLARLSRERPWTARDRQLVGAALGAVRQSVVQAAGRAALRENEEKLRLALDAAPVVLWTTDMQAVFTLTEGRGLTALGSAPGRMVGRSVREVYGANPAILANVDRALAGESFSAQLQIGERTYEARYAPLHDAGGQQVGAVGTGYDVTSTVRAQREAVRAREQAEALLELSRVLEADLASPSPELAQAALAALGRVLEGSWLTLWQRQGDTFFPLAQHGEALPAVRERQQRGIPASRYEALGVLEGRVFLTPGTLPADARQDGLCGAALLPVFREVPGWEVVLAAYRAGDFEQWSPLEQELLAAAARILGVTAQRRMHLRQMELAATTDPLTGLGNRRAFELALGPELSRAARHGGQVGLLSIDLDGLKAVNDGQGHARGDALLCEFAQRLRQCLRGEDRVYRLGGDEYVVVLPGARPCHADTLLARVRAAVDATRGTGFGGVDASVGLACFPEDAQDAGELVQLSDRRMYADKAAKQAGRAARPSGMSPEPV